MAIKINGYSNTGRLAKKARKRSEGEERNAKWTALSPDQKIAQLDRLGVAARRQRAKLQKGGENGE